jgi:peptidoglycan/LPS O-acetylase OafA/YrhL
MNREQIPSLTGLRFLAAAAVVLSHGIPQIVKYDNPPKLLALLSDTAGAGMTLFFVLSGFVIFLNYSSKIGTSVGLWNFFVARFARLYPLYFLAVSYDLLMKFSYNQFPIARASTLPFYATMTQSWVYKPVDGNALIYQFGLLPSVSWSISTEWFFYFAFPFICGVIWLLKSTPQKFVATAILVVAALFGLTLMNLAGDKIRNLATAYFGPIAANPQDGFFRWLAYFSPYVRVLEFILGCFCAAVYKSLPTPSAHEQRIGAWLTGGTACGIVLLHWYMFGVDNNTLTHALIQPLHMNFGFAPLMAALILCCVRYQNGFVSLMSGKWIVLGGEISYSMYLLHFVIIDVFRYPAPTITSWNVAVGSYLQLVMVLASIVGLSLISWRFVEMPLRRLFREALTIRPSTEPVIGKQQTAGL